jgi:HK97 family phage major capsid protein
MANAVLERLRAQRAEQIAVMDRVLEQVGDERDLVDAEQNLLVAARERIKEIDAQIAPLEEYEAISAAHRETQATLPRPAAPAPRQLAVNERAPVYATPGAFVVDYLRAHGIMDRGVRDDQAYARVTRAVSDQTTADTPGILPTMIVGGVVNLIDANRPLITSLGGARALGGIPGLTFSRPKVTQHTLVGPQPGEKQQLPSRQMKIDPVTFTKGTYGGTVDISRQDIDWTSPAAWDILVRDLADQYAIETETVVAAAFKTGATGTAQTVATDDLKGWVAALYQAAAASYQAGQRMPDRIWCSLDVWAELGSLVDVARVILPQDRVSEMGAPGTSTLASFAGDVLGLPRIVVPTFPAGTLIVGNSQLFEAYEEVIGLLSVIQPSILGVEVAFGGYAAFGSLAPSAFIPVTPPAAGP